MKTAPKKILINYLTHGRRKSTDVDYIKNFEAIASEALGIEICFNESKAIARFVEFFHKLDIQLRYFPFLQKKLRPFIRYWSTRTIIFPKQLEGVDAVLTHWYYPLFTPIKSVPVVYSSGFHGNHYAGFDNDEARKKSNNFLSVRKKINQSAISFFPSKSWITHFKSLLKSSEPCRPIVYIPHLLPEAKQQSFFDEAKFDQKTIQLIFVGRDGKRKGLEDLVAALKSLIAKHPKWKSQIFLTIISDLNIDLKAAGVPGQYLGEVTKPEVLQQMKASHIFCMPTHHESYGHVFVEAMGSSCAIIADDKDPRTSFFENGKIAQHVAPGNVENLEKALLEYFENRELMKKHAKACFEKFNQEYAYEVVLERLREVVLQVASDREFQLNQKYVNA